MRVLIVYAHPEPTSFNASMVAAATEALRSAGHEVKLSDLYAMKFDPVSDRRNFTTLADEARFDQQVEEKHASTHGGFSPDIAREMEKVAWCDLLVLQFPLWWMGMPAIMKGWLDRVLALGFAYGGGRWFDEGWLAGKKAVLSVTIGGPEEAYTAKGLYGPMETILGPIHRGILAFVGLTVLEPLLVHGPGRMTPEEREAALSSVQAWFASIERARAIPQPRSSDYERFVRRRRPLSFIRTIARHVEHLARTIVENCVAAGGHGLAEFR
jgi:NAD(P)H dehydrogenase (quinone)